MKNQNFSKAGLGQGRDGFLHLRQLTSRLVGGAYHRLFTCQVGRMKIGDPSLFAVFSAAFRCFLLSRAAQLFFFFF